MTSPRLLLVDDDADLVSMLKEYLEGEGFAVDTAADGATGAEAALSGEHALVVLDVMMPALGGIEALQRIRARSRVPVLMLTARGDDIDRIVGLELGADDYVPKPCTPRELAARIRAILRRTKSVADGEEQTVLRNGGLAMWPGQRRCEWDGKPVPLTSTEFNLLELLLRNVGRPVAKAKLSEQGLGRPLEPFDRSVDVHLSSIRQKLGALSDGRSCIETVYRRGYQLIRE